MDATSMYPSLRMPPSHYPLGGHRAAIARTKVSGHKRDGATRDISASEQRFDIVVALGVESASG